MRQYNRENCQAIVRKTVIDIYGRVICLVGRHAFEWSIIIESNNKIIITRYDNSSKAKEAFRRLTRKR